MVSPSKIGVWSLDIIMSRSTFSDAIRLAGALLISFASSHTALAGETAFKNGQFRFGASTHGIASAETGKEVQKAGFEVVSENVATVLCYFRENLPDREIRSVTA